MKKDIPLYRDRNLHVIFCVTLIVIMGVTTIAPAFPQISQALKISKKATGLLITVFTFPGIFLTPVLGILSDRVGRKKILVPSLFLFGISGCACAFTRNFDMLLVLRFAQGVGAASLGSLNLTILGDLYHGEKRTRALGYNSTVLSIGATAYPALGGAMAILGWNYPFFLSLLALPVGLAVMRLLDNPEPEKDGHIIDYLKNALVRMKDLQILTLFLGTLATFVLLYGVVFSYFSFYLKETFNASVFSIGMMIASASLGTLAGSLNLGRLSRHFSSKKLIMAGFCIYALSLSGTMLVKNYYLMLLPIICYGFANGINIPSTQTLLAETIPMKYRGAFMSVNAMVLRIGQTLGPLLAGLAFAADGIRGVFYAAVAFSLLILICIGMGLKETKAG